MKEIELSRGYKALVDDDKYDWLMQWKWNLEDKKNGCFYARRNNGQRKKMHQLLLPCPKGYMPDHKDGNGLNNQLSNLRMATRSQNKANSKPKNGSKYKGIYKKPSGNYQARIAKDHKEYQLGVYKTPEEAARAYDKKAIEFFGEFARLNFPDEK